MFYYKRIENGEVVEVGIHSMIVPSYAEEISASEYAEILVEFERKAEEEREANKPNNEYGIPDELYNSIIDDYTDELFEMGVL